MNNRSWRSASSSDRAGRRGAAFVGIAAVAGLLLAGCSTTPEPVRDAQARLDGSTNEIVMPLTEYLLPDRTADTMLYQAAERVAVGQCMNGQGYELSAARVTEDPLSYPGDWTYGLWDKERAAVYGAGLAPSAVDAAVAADEQAGGPGWTASFNSCNQSVISTEYPFIPTNDDVAGSVAGRLATEAYNAALEDERWPEAIERWWDCLRSEGLTPREEDGEWRTEQAVALSTDENASPEEKIRVAALEAGCNDDTQMAQTLANIEAGYQVALIDDNQAALNEEKERKQEIVSAARDFINQYG